MKRSFRSNTSDSTSPSTGGIRHFLSFHRSTSESNMVKGIGGEKKDKDKDKDTKKDERLKNKEIKKAEKEKQRAEKGTTRGKAFTTTKSTSSEDHKLPEKEHDVTLSPKNSQFLIAAPPANPFPPNLAAQLSPNTSFSSSSGSEGIISVTTSSPPPAATTSTPTSPTPAPTNAPAKNAPEKQVTRVNTPPSHGVAAEQVTSPKIESRPTETPKVVSPPVRVVAEKQVTRADTEKYRLDSDKNINLLKTKLAALPEENKVVVEYLLNIFGKIVPSQWKAPANLELPSVEDQVEVTLDKLLEASEILFNKDHHAMLKKYTKEMNESPARRVEKWKLLAGILAQHKDFLDLFISSNTLEAAVKSAVAQPVEDDEAEVLLDLLRYPLSIESVHKDLLSVIKASSYSNQHVKASVDGIKSLSDAIIELVASFKKQKLDEVAHPPPVIPDTPRDKKDLDAAAGTTLSLALLEHATVITHAKTGHDLSTPLGKFFEEQITQEETKGEQLQEKSTVHKKDTEKRIEHMDSEIKQEQAKLSGVQTDIKDLEFKLVQKRAEEKALEELLAHQVEQRQKYKEEQEKLFIDISDHIATSKTQLDHHTHSSQSISKFSTDVSELLDKEVNETIKKTRDVLVELDKEVSFLEEKMASYDRSFSLFSAADEPEVLDGLKKLFVRSAAIYVESKQSVARVKSVVVLLHSVIGSGPQQNGNEMAQVKEIEVSLDKIVQRQNALNTKYKLQKN